jgi:hypothetical protein
VGIVLAEEDETERKRGLDSVPEGRRVVGMGARRVKVTGSSARERDGKVKVNLEARRQRADIV